MINDLDQELSWYYDGEKGKERLNVGWKENNKAKGIHHSMKECYFIRPAWINTNELFRSDKLRTHRRFLPALILPKNERSTSSKP